MKEREGREKERERVDTNLILYFSFSVVVSRYLRLHDFTVGVRPLRGDHHKMGAVVFGRLSVFASGLQIIFFFCLLSLVRSHGPLA